MTMMQAETAVRGAPKTRATVIRLRDVLGDLVGRQRARMVVEHLVRVELLPKGERRFSAPVNPQQAAIALLVAACDDGDAPRAFGRAMLIAGQRRHEPGCPPGPTVANALMAELQGLRRDPELEPREWHLGLASTKALSAEGQFDSFDLYLPAAPVDADAPRLKLPYERIDVLPGCALRDVAELWR